MPLANIKRRKSIPGQGITKLKRSEQKTVYSILYYFYAPGLKGPPGASSNRIVRLSVCLSVIPSRFQTKCNIESLGCDTV